MDNRTPPRSRPTIRRLVIGVLLSLAASIFPLAPSGALAAVPGSAAAEARRIRDVCRAHGLEIVEESTAQCSHGEDPAPPGMDIKRDVEPVRAVSPSEFGAAGKVAPAAPSFPCDGDGQAGYRTQVIYVHASGTANRYSTYKASFIQWAWEADQIYRNSAQGTGGIRRIRFVHDSSCTPTVLNLTLSSSGDDNLSNTITELQQAGYNRSDRKYMVFVDANVLCGVGTMSIDDRPGQENWNNIGPDYARIDAGCWSGDIAAHEHMHNMGGVQNTSPHASGGNHCTDEYDVMCYSDSPNYPTMTINCPGSSRNYSHFDCNYDDYFHTSPPAGSYLATRWNTANNRFLATDAGGGSAPVCPDQGSEPDETFTDAGALTLGAVTSRALCTAGDQDWMSFQASANQRYRVEIVGHAQSITPALEVYASNGKKLLSSNTPAPGGPAALEFRARTGGTHYVRVESSPGAFTPSIDNVYQVRVSGASPNGSPIGGFGYNAYNQAGGPASAVRLTPGLSFNDSAVQVAGGAYHNAAVLNDGTVRTWGWNAFGQLGNGTLTDSAGLVRASGLTGVAAVAGGLIHTLALKTDGTVWAWGWNGVGQLGDGTLTDRSVPVKVSGLSDVVEISAGWFHNLALKRDGSVWVWGHNGLNQLGEGTAADRAVPVKLALPKVTAVSAGGYHSLVALADGTARAWGYNGQAQLGDGSRASASTPKSVAGLTNVYRVSAGAMHSVALRNDGSVLAWGVNAQQQSGGAVTADRPFASSVSCSSDTACPKIPGTSRLGGIAWISASSAMHSLALAEDGTVWSWGWNGLNQLGDGTSVDSGTAVKAAVSATDVAAGAYHSLYRT